MIICVLCASLKLVVQGKLNLYLTYPKSACYIFGNSLQLVVGIDKGGYLTVSKFRAEEIYCKCDHQIGAHKSNGCVGDLIKPCCSCKYNQEYLLAMVIHFRSLKLV